MKTILFLVNKDNVVYNFRKELVMELLNSGYRVVISSPYGKKIDLLVEKGAEFDPLQIDRRGKNILNDLKLIRDYYRQIKRINPDVVLSYTTKCSIYGGIACRMLGKPYIVNNAGLYRNEDFNKIVWFVLRILFRVGFSHANCLMYQNTYERDTLNKIISKKVHYRDIPGSGVNLEEFPMTSYPADDKIIRFNYVARIVKIKGIEELLECATRIKEKYSNTEFILYGDFDDDTYRERVKGLEEKGIVKYGGIQLDMKPCIERAHAVIHPSYYEGVTNVILEHGAMGRPAIASDIPGCREGIDYGMSGYTFPVQNINALVEVVEQFILLPHEKKVAMGMAARKKMENEFDRKIVTNIYMEEIMKILKQY